VLRVARLEWRRGVRRRDGVAGIADRARLVPPAAAAAKHRDAADTDEPGRDARTQPSPARPVPLEPRAASCEHWWLRSADGARLSRTHRGGRGMTSFLSVFDGARTFLRSGSIAVAAGLLVMSAGAANAQTGISRGDRYAGQPWATRSPVLGQHGMIASEQPLASRVGVEILKKGGSAVDAAIATSAMLCLTEPVLNGMGADAFVIVYDPKTRKLYGYNGSGWSPKGRSLKSMQAQVKAAYEQAGMQPTDQIPLLGPLPITVPGIVDTWFALHAKFGKLPIAEDLAPAIDYATHGFPVTEVVAEYWAGNWKGFEKHRGLIKEFQNAQKTFLIDGHTPRQGEIFRNPDMAHTLALIAQGGRDAFYKGEIAHVMADFFKRIGTGPDYSDFADFHGEWVTPQSVDYRGYDVYELPPNGQGFATLEMLNVLKGFDLKKMGPGNPDTLMAEI